MSFMFRRTIVVTHNGTFHTDDVAAMAVLSIVFKGKIKIVRTRDISLIEKADIVVDVGSIYEPLRNRFDHHQEGGAGKRANSIPYAALGLVWKEYGEKACGSKDVADMLDRKIIQYIDAVDNGVDVSRSLVEGVQMYSFGDVVRSYIPQGDAMTDAVLYKRFCEAVEMAKNIFTNEIESAVFASRSFSAIAEAYEHSSDKQLLILEKKGLPWRDVAQKYPQLLYVVEQHSSGDTWRISSVRSDPSSFALRKSLPESWAGKRDQELAKIAGVEDAIFCHNGRFLAVAKSKEGVLKLAKIALTY
jgi:uncharacterized UPF0160 family protein